MGMPGAGELTKKITIQKQTINKGAQGGVEKTWQDHLPNIWAKVNNLSGNERSLTAHGGKVGEARTVFTIRYRPNITAEGHRIMFKGRLYDIQHVNNFQEENRFLVITCDTGVVNA